MGGHAADLHILPISGFHQKGWKHNRSFQKQNKKDTRQKKTLAEISNNQAGFNSPKLAF